VLTAILMAELLYVFVAGPSTRMAIVEVGPRQVGLSLLGPYLLALELASMLLLLGLIGAHHLARGQQGTSGNRTTEEGGI